MKNPWAKHPAFSKEARRAEVGPSSLAKNAFALRLVALGVCALPLLLLGGFVGFATYMVVVFIIVGFDGRGAVARLMLITFAALAIMVSPVIALVAIAFQALAYWGLGGIEDKIERDYLRAQEMADYAAYRRGVYRAGKEWEEHVKAAAAAAAQQTTPPPSSTTPPSQTP